MAYSTSALNDLLMGMYLRDRGGSGSRGRNNEDTEARPEPGSRKFSVQETSEKGKGWVATSDIKRGEKLLVEFPIILAPSVGQMKLTTKEDLKSQIDGLEKKKRDEFLDLNDPDPTGSVEGKNLRILDNNMFPDGLLLICSRMNHSCFPNVLLSSDADIPSLYDSVEVRALRDIGKGEEITVSYLRLSELRNRSERQQKIAKWNFECICKICSLTGDQLSLNEKFREKARENTVKIDQFLDGLHLVGFDPRNLSRYKRQLVAMFKFGMQNIEILQTHLVGEADVRIVKDISNLAVLSAYGSFFQQKLDSDEGVAVYMERAKKKANELGEMFLSNCRTTEKEIRQILFFFHYTPVLLFVVGIIVVYISSVFLSRECS